MLVPVILSGGAGTRLWPRSRQRHPKQFLPLLDGATTFERTLARVEGLAGITAPLIVCNADHRSFVEAQLRRHARFALAVVLEPVGRNTAPAVAIAAEHARTVLGGDPLLLVLPADHLVTDVAAFHAAVQIGMARADAGELVTFGIVPDRPETGYGYIHAATPGQPSAVRAFVEKPDRATAQAWIDDGEHYWNSGMFVFRASTYLHELAAHRPEMIEPCAQALARAQLSEGAVSLDVEAFSRCPSDSIDYAVMERTDRAAVVPMAAGWTDIGSWDALWQASDRDEHDNAIAGDVLAIDASGCHLDAQHGLLAAIGVRDLVVVATEDAVLVTARDRSQDVKLVFDRLRADDRPLAREHPCRVHAWGTEHVVAALGVTRLEIRAGATAIRSATDHARVLVVIDGTAVVEHGTVQACVEAGQSATLPADCEIVVRAAGASELVAVELDIG